MDSDIHAVVEAMNAYLGPTLVAALAGSRDRTAPERWAAGGHLTVDQERRLRTAHAIWGTLTRAESEDIARAWFIGSNPDLGSTPITALREDRLLDVTQVAEGYVEQSRGAVPHPTPPSTGP